MDMDTAININERVQSFCRTIMAVDSYLDERVADCYKEQPWAQDWARVAKIMEEGGEAVAELIAWSGQNPRKPQDEDARGRLLTELQDVALTAIYAIQHFTKEDDARTAIFGVWDRAAYHRRRLEA
jgi:hypothetical protein